MDHRVALIFKSIHFERIWLVGLRTDCLTIYSFTSSVNISKQITMRNIYNSRAFRHTALGDFRNTTQKYTRRSVWMLAANCFAIIFGWFPWEACDIRVCYQFSAKDERVGYVLWVNKTICVVYWFRNGYIGYGFVVNARHLVGEVENERCRLDGEIWWISHWVDFEGMMLFFFRITLSWFGVFKQIFHL